MMNRVQIKDISPSILFFTACLFLLFGCGEVKNEKEVKNTEAPKVQANEEPEKNQKEEKYIVFFGNSLTAGYGLQEGESFPDLVQKRIDDQQLNFKVVNAGLSGETTAGGDSRINWVLKQPMDIFVLELGANDMLRGLDLKSTEKNLQNIVDKVRKAKGDIPIVVAAVQAPDNMGQEYKQTFNQLFPTLAKKNNAYLIPFLLEGVAMNPQLNLKDGIHPNAEGQKVVLENVWKIIAPILK